MKSPELEQERFLNTYKGNPSSTDSWVIVGKLWKPLANGGLACQ